MADFLEANAKTVTLIAVAALSLPVYWFFALGMRWYANRVAERVLKRVLNGGTTKRAPGEHRIVFDEVGFSVQSNRTAVSQDPVSWSEIIRASALKLVVGVVDCVYIRFDCDDGTSVHVNEEMDAWTDLCDELPRLLPSCLPLKDWIWDVTRDPGETNEKEIYQRRRAAQGDT